MFPPLIEGETNEIAWAITQKGNKFQPVWIPRGAVGNEDVKFELLYSGICHTDIHFGHDDLKNTKFPIVPGHELLGKVTEIG